MRQSKLKTIDQASIQPLLDIFKIMQETGSSVDAVCYRAQHEELLSLLDTLENKGYLRKEDEKYRVTLVGLTLLADSHVSYLFENFEKIFSALRTYYKSTPREPLLVKDLADMVALPFKETLVCLEYMSEGPWWSGRSVGLNQDPQNPISPFIKPSESILKYKTFHEIIEEAKHWREMRESKSVDNKGANPFSNVLSHIKKSPMDILTSVTLERFDAEHVKEVWQKALDRRSNDPEGAITASRTLLESVCKHILEEDNVKYPDDADLPKLYTLTAKELSLAPSQHTEQLFKQILGGCQTVVEGLGAIRNRLSDAHGKGKSASKPAPRHAELAVNLAGTMATFLIATWEARKKP